MASTILQILLVTMAVAMTTVSGTTRADYCALCQDHTLCKYPGVSQACGQLLAQGVASGDQQVIVARHNDLRRKVAQGQEGAGSPGPQPQAADMLALVWDNELAQIAQRWVEQCIFGHDSCRNVARFYVGQNMYMSMSSNNDQTPSWISAVDGWYNEVKDQDRNKISPFSYTGITGHYTQVIWGKTSTIGCGYVRYYDAQSKWYKKVYGCNYGTGGNVVGLGNPAYQIGTACSKCPAGTWCNYGLCSK